MRLLETQHHLHPGAHFRIRLGVVRVEVPALNVIVPAGASASTSAFSSGGTNRLGSLHGATGRQWHYSDSRTGSGQPPLVRTWRDLSEWVLHLDGASWGHARNPRLRRSLGFGWLEWVA